MGQNHQGRDNQESATGAHQTGQHTDYNPLNGDQRNIHFMVGADLLYFSPADHGDAGRDHQQGKQQHHRHIPGQYHKAQITDGIGNGGDDKTPGGKHSHKRGDGKNNSGFKSHLSPPVVLKRTGQGADAHNKQGIGRGHNGLHIQQKDQYGYG